MESKPASITLTGNDLYLVSALLRENINNIVRKGNRPIHGQTRLYDELTSEVMIAHEGAAFLEFYRMFKGTSLLPYEIFEEEPRHSFYSWAINSRKMFPSLRVFTEQLKDAPMAIRRSKSLGELITYLTIEKGLSGDHLKPIYQYWSAYKESDKIKMEVK